MSEDLQDFFSALSKARKEKEKEIKESVPQKEEEPITIDAVFSEVANLKKESKKKKLEEEKKKRKQKKQVEALESWLYSKPNKEEVVEEEIKEESSETIEESHKYPFIPQSEFEGESCDIEDKPEDNEEENVEIEEDTVDHALKILETIKSKEEVRENVTDPEIVKIRRELEYLKNLVNVQGGGGEVRLEFLDDVDRDSAKVDGKFLKYDDASKKWIGADASGGGGSIVGIDTRGTSYFNDIYATGVVTATSFVGDGSGLTNVGVDTSNISATTLVVSGVSTLGSNNGIGTVTIGLGETALYVDGSARVIGILTVGRGSVTIDGDNNKITTGIVTITNSTVTIGQNVTINAGATGINSAPNVLYVAKDGNDDNNGTSIDNAKLTIAGAVGVATTGTIIKVLAGNYLETNPIEVPAFVSIVGDDLKTVTVSPNIAYKDIFHVRKGCYLANMTFTNHVSPAAAVGFPTSEIATNVGGGKWESPYIQNCTSNTTTGTGLRIDGAQAESLKSIVCDSYTQYNQGGVGVAITNEGFAQLVSVFTICCNEAITCYKGSTCDLTNSNSSFGSYGLVSDGVSSELFTGIVTTSAASGQDTVTVAINTTTRPYDGQVVYFNQLYQSVDTIEVTNGGSGYTSTPTVSIEAPTGPNGESATAFATLSGDTVESITIINSGNQYVSTPNITISAPDSGTTATASINMSPIYYTINSSTPIVSGITTLTLDENLINTIGVGSTAHFFQVSRIVASSHTFEYVGSGNTITTAIPKRGGVTIQENEVVTTNGGKVVYTSTDQSGNFRIGDDFTINQNTGTISGRAFSRSLFSEMTPFILALS